MVTYNDIAFDLVIPDRYVLNTFGAKTPQRTIDSKGSAQLGILATIDRSNPWLSLFSQSDCQLHHAPAFGAG
jgi:hypothetical protein